MATLYVFSPVDYKHLEDGCFVNVLPSLETAIVPGT